MKNQLINGLKRIQSTNLDLPLVPLNGKKQPLGDDWQNRPFKASELIEAIASGGVTVPIKGKTKKIQLQGFGLLTGRPISINSQTYYLMAVDQDGPSVINKINELSDGSGLPTTVAFTSGRTGRCQYLYLVPEQFKDAIRTKKIKAGTGEDGKPELLELRWSNLQSVLPPSVHPITGQYHWLENCAIDEVEMAIAPDWIVEQMLITQTSNPTTPLVGDVNPQATTNGDKVSVKPTMEITVPVSAPVPLLQCCRKEVRDWVASGVPEGSGRNDTAINVGLELIGVERYLQTIGQSYTDSALSLFHEFCVRSGMTATEESERYQWCQKTNSRPSCPPDAIESCIKGWYWREVVKTKQSHHQSVKTEPKSRQYSSKNSRVTGDNQTGGDAASLVPLTLSQTVTYVTAVLEKGFPHYEERHHLDVIEGKSVMSRTAFWKLVSSLRCGFEEITGGDRARLWQLIEGNNKTLPLDKLLPKPLANTMNHDALILNIDAVILWQYLLPAVLSLVGKNINLDVESHKIPAILWTCIVGESGTGKSRGENLILAPLKKLQHQERKRFLGESEQYLELEKNRSSDDPPNEPPQAERKYLFEVSTIQGIMKRLSEQVGNGSVWARDELPGIFKSLNQFTRRGGDNEGLECLLKMWDGDGAFVERVNALENSYNIEETRLSITGGIQPGAFRDVFKNPDDPQGLQARFLYATPKIRPAKRVKGYCYLSEILPAFYQWLDHLPDGVLKLSDGADLLYSQLVEEIGIEAEKCDSGAQRAWMRKLSSQLLRIAFALHFIDCYYQPERSFWILEADTLERAWLACGYYRSCFDVVTQKANESEDMSSILLKIQDFSLNNPDGLTPRDIYRKVKAISRRAKELGRDVAAYTLELLGQLVNMGLGILEKNGRFYRFKALVPSSINSNSSVSETVVTQAQTANPSASDVSPAESVSPVTLTTEQSLVTSQSLEIKNESIESESDNCHNQEVAPSTKLSEQLATNKDADIKWLLKLLNDLEGQSPPTLTDEQWWDLLLEAQEKALKHLPLLGATQKCRIDQI